MELSDKRFASPFTLFEAGYCMLIDSIPVNEITVDAGEI